MVYYEKQRGGLCRLHSLNAYYGHQKLSDSDFSRLCQEYNQEIKKKYNLSVPCQSYDIIPPDQSTIISYVLKKDKVGSIYVPFNYLSRELKERNQSLSNLLTDFVFVYNQGHIWGIKDKKYKVDSLSGVSNFNINSLINNRNIGLIIPIDSKACEKELKYRISQVQNYLLKNSVNLEIKKIEKFLSELVINGNILGDLEVYLGVISNLLEILEIRKDILDRYLEFSYKFTGNYYNVELVLKYVPGIIMDLSKMREVDFRYKLKTN